ncbi:Metallo-dependent phosphatase [Epithele typhae]|uniref:Metallo-dependent phosphatase n=1 Tax=Epithele typhae TaxID=378194 RepID=UPI002008C795|nr:Metallo-dependent phosphatase [Epithele typhae]KAH9942328.1 Metallo-dependent phosphatase [Epithele typhae]
MYPRLVNFFRLFWLLLVAWYELGTFYHHTAVCPWPDQLFIKPEDSPTHVLVVADPQILDMRSYPDRPPWLQTLTQLMVDLYIRKSWRAVLRRRPDAIVFLGDMMDNGRLAMSDQEYEAYVRRFRSIFAADSSVPMHYLPGNHDIGLGVSSEKYRFDENALQRYKSHFGPLNQRVSIANHTVWMIDAPGLVDEDRERLIARKSFTEWAEARPDRTIAFVQSYVQDSAVDRTGTILFTHVPLSRPEMSPCGPLREGRTLRQGRGLGYQNLLLPEASQFLLQSIRPSVVFSGDDHDYCEYEHTYTGSKLPAVPEITVKSFSMAMGIRKPGYQLLSLIPPKQYQSGPSFAHQPCLLPNQLSIYLSVYVPFIVITLLALLVSNFRRVSSPPRSVTSPTQDTVNFDLPPPSAWRTKGFPRQAWSKTWTIAIGGRPRNFTLSPAGFRRSIVAFFWTGGSRAPDSTRGGGVLVGFLKDFREAAWAPLALFAGIAWWAW